MVKSKDKFIFDMLIVDHFTLINKMSQ
jgi:hypothetical protein